MAMQCIFAWDVIACRDSLRALSAKMRVLLEFSFDNPVSAKLRPDIPLIAIKVFAIEVPSQQELIVTSGSTPASPAS